MLNLQARSAQSFSARYLCPSGPDRKNPPNWYHWASMPRSPRFATQVPPRFLFCSLLRRPATNIDPGILTAFAIRILVQVSLHRIPRFCFHFEIPQTIRFVETAMFTESHCSAIESQPPFLSTRRFSAVRPHPIRNSPCVFSSRMWAKHKTTLPLVAPSILKVDDTCQKSKVQQPLPYIRARLLSWPRSTLDYFSKWTSKRPPKIPLPNCNSPVK